MHARVQFVLDLDTQVHACICISLPYEVSKYTSSLIFIFKSILRFGFLSPTGRGLFEVVSGDELAHKMGRYFIEESRIWWCGGC